MVGGWLVGEAPECGGKGLFSYPRTQRFDALREQRDHFACGSTQTHAHAYKYIYKYITYTSTYKNIHIVYPPLDALREDDGRAPVQEQRDDLLVALRRRVHQGGVARLCCFGLSGGGEGKGIR